MLICPKHIHSHADDDLQGSELDAHQSFSKVPRRLPEVRLVLLGERETGKSSAGNSILGGAGIFQAGVVTEECVREQAEVAKRLVTVVDTPGWEAAPTGGPTERVKRELAASVGLCPPGPHALLLTLRVDTLVVAGHVRDHLELLSEGVWRHTLLLFTHGDQLREGVNIQQHIQGGGRDLGWLLEKCRGRYHVISSLDGGERGRAGATDLLQKVEMMAVMNRCEAFSGLVHEIRVLSQQKNEKFNQRMKEMGDKMLRQEAELKKMREREMKSIRWIFERKKKVKLHEKTGVQREEEEDEDSRNGGRKADCGELEERMRWLAEDKEREIQELSFERERIQVALSQSMKERDNATFRLDLKQRELEELKERIDELLLKLLNLECASVEKENQRRHREESIEVMKRKWLGEVQTLAEDLELQKKENGEWMEKVRSLQTEMEESKMQQENVLRRKTHETNTAMAEMEQRLKGEMGAKLLAKEQQQGELRGKMQAILNHAKLCERQMEIKVEEMKSQHEKEVARTTQDKEAAVQMLKLQHREEMERNISEMRKMQEELKAQHQKELAQMEAIKKQHEREKTDLQREKEGQVAELKRVFANEAERQVQAKMRDLEDRYLAQLEKKASERKDENERIQMNFRKEVTIKIQEKEREIELLHQQHQEEMERRLKETERREEQIKEMEKAVEELKEEYNDKIRGAEKNSQTELKELRQQFEQEIEKLFKERQRMLEYVLELEERVTESEKAKEAMIENHKKSILLHLKEREAHVEELKHEHISEIQNKVQELEKEKERTVRTLQEEAENIRNAKETELTGLKLGLSEMNQKLQQMEDEKRDLEEKLAERSREMEVTNARLIELEHQLRWTAEERETDERHLHEKLKERDETIETLNQRITEMNEILRRKEEEEDDNHKEVEQRLQGRERELEEMTQQLLKERQRERESLCQQARWRDEQRQKENEINTVKELMEQKTRQITEAQQLLAEREREVKEAKTECASYLNAMKEMEERCEKQNVALLRIQESHGEQLRRKDAEMMEKVKESEEEVHRLRRENGAKEKELALLRSRIEQTKSELKDVSRKMEKEMTGMIGEYEKEIERKNRILASVAEEKDRAVERCDEGRRRTEELQVENEKIKKVAESLRLKLKTEAEEEAKRYFQEQVESREADLKEKDAQISRLKETQDRLQGELDIMAEEKGEAERKIQIMKEDFQVKRSEKQGKFTTKKLQIKEDILKRENEVAEREKVLGRNEETLSKRGYELNRKEEELVDKGITLENKAHELSEMQGLSEKWREERSKYRRDEKRRGEELWERAREEPTMLPNGRENEEGRTDEQCSVREDEQQKHQERGDARSWRLAGTAAEGTVMEGQLHNTGRSWSNGEEQLKEREGELHKDEEKQRVQEDSSDFANDDLHLVHGEVVDQSDREETTKEKEDWRMVGAETVKVMIAEVKEGVEGTDAQGKKTKNPSKAKVMRASQLLSAGRRNRGSHGSDLRVMVLGESWSPRAPAGVTILCGETSKQDGSTFRHWRGQVAGHRLSVVEPLGLKWRDGPGPNKAGQRKSVLDSVSQCGPGPHVVLLLLPAFLTCTQRLRSAVEEHVSWLGADVWRRALVLFTWGETLGESVEQHVLRNRELMELVGKCEGRYHVVTSNKNSSLVEGLLEKMEDIVAMNRF